MAKVTVLKEKNNSNTGRRAAPESANSRLNQGLNQEEIAYLAYSYWEARGRQGGSPEEDWLRAEREIAARQIAMPTRTRETDAPAGAALATRAGGRSS